MTRPRSPIQIWQPDNDGWVRPAPGPFGDHYSPTLRLEPRQPDGPPRVVLVGESVARGYLYCPGWNPATAVASALPEYEIIDLARTNESLGSLAETVVEALQLEPDVVVMWAGNNWMLRDLASLAPRHPRAQHRVALGDGLRTAGEWGAISLARSALRELAKPLLDELLGRLDRAATRLVVIVPEVNLHDWNLDEPPSGFSRCIDDTTGDVDKQRLAIELAAGPLRAHRSPPMIASSTQEFLRSWCRRARVDHIDVASLIERRNERADRDWFLDYCHHTSHGIVTVARAVAECVAGHPVAALVTGPTPENEAVAFLGAAVHRAHTQLPSSHRDGQMSFWIERATAIHPVGQRLRRAFIDSRLDVRPEPLRPAIAELAAAGFGFAHGLRPAGVELELLCAMGADDRELSALGIRPTTHPAAGLTAPNEPPWIDIAGEDHGETPAYLRSLRPTTLLVVARPPIEADIEPRLGLVLRTPKANETQWVGIRIGQWNTTLPASPKWRTHRVRVPADAIETGPVRVELSWPPIGSLDAHREDVLAALTADLPTDLHPIRGEIYQIGFEPSR